MDISKNKSQDDNGNQNNIQKVVNVSVTNHTTTANNILTTKNEMKNEEVTFRLSQNDDMDVWMESAVVKDTQIIDGR